MFQQKRGLIFPSLHFKLLILTSSIDTRALITLRIPDASGRRAWNACWLEPISKVLGPPPLPAVAQTQSFPALSAVPLRCRVSRRRSPALRSSPFWSCPLPPSVWQVKPLIWIDSVIEKFSHSRVEIKVKVGDKQTQTRTHAERLRPYPLAESFDWGLFSIYDTCFSGGLLLCLPSAGDTESRRG